jgi:hypothetical protein
MECRFQVTTPTTVFQSRRIHERTPPKGQGIKFSGVGAKWQNGVAENAVKIVTLESSGTDDPRFPSLARGSDPEPVAHAVSYAAHLYNNTPNKESGIAPVEIFTGKSDYQALRIPTPGDVPLMSFTQLCKMKRIPKWGPGLAVDSS